MKILVTGAAGFLGRECVALLKERGHEVITTDRVGAVDHLGDLADAPFTAQLPAVDVLVHCAAVQYVSADLPLWQRERYFRRNNITVTHNLCERYRGQSTHFVNVGTSMMYDQTGTSRYDTTSPMNAQGVYSRSKLTAFDLVRSLPNTNATVIPCIIGGVGREGLFRGFVSSMLRRGVVVFPGAGAHPTSMVHVKDVAGLISKVVESRASGLFNAAALSPLSIGEWVTEIENELGLAPVKRLRLPLAPIHALSAALGYRLLAREQLLMLAQPHVLAIDASLQLGWLPRFDNARIVRDIARYIASTLDGAAAVSAEASRLGE